MHGCDGEIPDLAEDDLAGIPEKDGVYIIASPQTKFVYPKGLSKIICIGKAKSIRRRLKEHRTNMWNAKADRNGEWWRFGRYNYMNHHGAKVYYYCCKGYQESKNQESMILKSFYDKYGAIPVGNGARSFQHDIMEGEK